MAYCQVYNPMNVNLELHEPFDPAMPTHKWKLTINGNPFPCDAKSVMGYVEALEMIELFQSIEGTTEDD